jgi:hypothetical protein
MKRRAIMPPTIAECEAMMQQAWYDLIVAEEHGKDAPTLERLFAHYLRALETFVAARKAGKPAHYTSAEMRCIA